MGRSRSSCCIILTPPYSEMAVTTAWSSVGSFSTSYVAGASFRAATGTMVLLVNYTKGSEDTIQLSIEGSDNNTDWYPTRDASGNDVSQVTSLTGTGKYRVITISLFSGETRARLKVKASGSVASPGSCTIKVCHNPIG